MPEWSKFNFDIGGRESARFDDITHVAHVPDARKIADDLEIRWRPVYDESRLNKTRIHVCWTSGNYWHNGSIYGTVEFSFPFQALIAGKEIYWIEAIETYRPPAFRFLFTSKGKPPIPEAVLYDPRSDDGPLKLDRGLWYRNQNFTSEFIFEDTLKLDLCKKIQSIPHNQNICRLNGNSCAEFKSDWTRTAALFVGHLLGTRNKELNALIAPDIGLRNGKPSMTMLQAAASGFFAIALKKDLFAGAIGPGSEARTLFRASALQYSAGDRAGARKTAALMNSQDTFVAAMNQVIAKHFDVAESDLE